MHIELLSLALYTLPLPSCSSMRIYHLWKQSWKSGFVSSFVNCASSFFHNFYGLKSCSSHCRFNLRSRLASHGARIDELRECSNTGMLYLTMHCEPVLYPYVKVGLTHSLLNPIVPAIARIVKRCPDRIRLSNLPIFSPFSTWNLRTGVFSVISEYRKQFKNPRTWKHSLPNTSNKFSSDFSKFLMKVYDRSLLHQYKRYIDLDEMAGIQSKLLATQLFQSILAQALFILTKRLSWLQINMYITGTLTTIHKNHRLTEIQGAHLKGPRYFSINIYSNHRKVNLLLASHVFS